MLNGLDLFSGIGGLTIALSEWVRPLAYCEIDPYAQAVLLNRMHERMLPRAPIWDDIRSFPTGEIAPIDIIYGGFPCQDISSAGTREGLEGKRSGLFFEVVRLTKETRPRFVFLENVAGIRPFVPRIRAEFEAIGYECRDGFISAPPLSGFEGIRWFLLAAAESVLGEEWLGIHKKYAHHESTREKSRTPFQANNADLPKSWEPAFSETCRDSNGLPRRVDRLKALGNGVVPEQARTAFIKLVGLTPPR